MTTATKTYRVQGDHEIILHTTHLLDDAQNYARNISGAYIIEVNNNTGSTSYAPQR